jgi:hypothetical protein
MEAYLILSSIKQAPIQFNFDKQTINTLKGST